MNENQNENNDLNIIEPKLEAYDEDKTFDYEKHKIFFNETFFKNSKLYLIGSKELDDFWSFVKKYQHLKRKKDVSLSNILNKTQKHSEKYKLPLEYDRRYRFNFVYKADRFQQATYDLQGNKIESKISQDRLNEFEFVINLYIDFSQKEKFKKLKQLRAQQSNLPIHKYKQIIVDTIRDNQVVLVAGDTGCGKSTQIPRYLLEHGCTHIACTQPRRIACMSLAKRVSYETLNEYKSEVAYQVRFERTRTKRTKILFLTEGVLIRQIQTDPLLSQYEYIVVDEVHERHVFTDFLLGILKCLIEQRRDLKLILMSATINIDLFSKYFGKCTVIKIPGRTFKIDVEYVPIAIEKDPLNKTSNKIDARPFIRLMKKIDEKYSSQERGDMLIFLSGMSDIQHVYEAAHEYAQETKKWIVLELHSSLSIEEQEKVFDLTPVGVRKCILSTNIAETSVTIDGLRFVVDSGKVKEISYDPKYKMQRLQEFWISRASAEQRKGRAGRTGPGLCFRLYSQSDYNSFNEFTTPEIQRVPLNSLLLQMISMGLKDVRKFPFIEAPLASNIDHSLLFLIEQNALKDNEELTSMGKMLAELPVDIQIGKMLILASLFHTVEPVVTMAAALSVQTPFLSNLRCDYDTMQARKELIWDHGDPITLLNAYNEWIQVKTMSGDSSKSWCKRRGLEEQRFYEISKLKKQFYELLSENYLLKSELSNKREDLSIDTDSAYDRKLKNEKLYAEKEKKRLLSLKRKLESKPKKPKLLSLDDSVSYLEANNDANSEEVDVRDIEFKLMHNLNDLQDKSVNLKKVTSSDIGFLKIILACGLYPQIAIADEFNNYKRDSDQIFHSKYKMGAVLHPTSIFAYDPDILQPPVETLKFDKYNFSNKYQLLLYVTLFETNKSYLMNCLRIPALQTLLLYSKTIDTNSNLTRLICDSWLELRFLDSEAAQTIISTIVYLRSAIEKLFQYRLNDCQTKNDNDEIAANKLEKTLKQKLTEFIDSDVLYSLRRVLPAELNTVYTRIYDQHGDVESNKSIPTFLKGFGLIKVDEVKGGIRITDYMTYNCLVSDNTAQITSEYAGNMQRHWTCKRCSREFLFNLSERMEHEVECIGNESLNDKNASVDKDTRLKDSSVGANEYKCKICNQTFYMTPIEILKHQKSHC